MKYVTHILIGILLLQPVAVLAASEGPNGPGTLENDTGTGTTAWNSVENAAASDDVRAFTSQNGVSNYLFASNFGFTVPSTATIIGISLNIEKYANRAGLVGPGFVTIVGTTDTVIQLTKDGSIMIGSNKADTESLWQETDATTTYGSSADLWGTTWNPNEVNAASFGVFVSGTRHDSAACFFPIGGDITCSTIDSISITVYYTLPTTRGSAGKTLRLKQKRSAGYVRSDVVPPTPQEVGIFRYLEQEDPVLVTAKQEREALQQLRVFEARKATVVQEIPPPRLVRLEKKKMEYAQGNRVQALHAAAVEKEVPSMCERVEKRLRGKSEEVKARAWKRVRMRSGYSCSL